MKRQYLLVFPGSVCRGINLHEIMTADFPCMPVPHVIYYSLKKKKKEWSPHYCSAFEDGLYAKFLLTEYSSVK